MIEYPAADFRYKDGFITIRVDANAEALVGTLKTGQIYAKLGKPRKPRTTGDGSQSHHLNGHIQQVANAMGIDFDRIKMLVKIEARELGYPGIEYFGIWIPQSEADSDTVECGYLIESVHKVAAQFGITLIENEPEIASKPTGYYKSWETMTGDEKRESDPNRFDYEMNLELF